MVVVIPAHNEAGNIAELVLWTRVMLPQARIVVVDDGSTDSMAQVAANTKQCVIIRNAPGSEYGDGFEVGLQYARENRLEPVVFMDAGLSHSPRDILELLEELPGHDVVIGSRLVRGAVYYQVWWRKALTQVAVRAFALASLSRVMDYSSFRAFSSNACQRLLDEGIVSSISSKKAHAFNPQLLALMRKRHFKIAQVPITYLGTNSTLNWRRFLGATSSLLTIIRRR